MAGVTGHQQYDLSAPRGGMEQEVRLIEHELAHLTSLRNAAERRWAERRTEAEAAAELSSCLEEESEMLLACVQGLDLQIQQLKEWAACPVGPQPTIDLRVHKMLFHTSPNSSFNGLSWEPSPTASFAIPGITAPIPTDAPSTNSPWTSSLRPKTRLTPIRHSIDCIPTTKENLNSNDTQPITLTITPYGGPWKPTTRNVATEISGDHTFWRKTAPQKSDVEVQADTHTADDEDAHAHIQLVVRITPVDMPITTSTPATEQGAQTKPLVTDTQTQAEPTLCSTSSQTDNHMPTLVTINSHAPTPNTTTLTADSTTIPGDPSQTQPIIVTCTTTADESAPVVESSSVTPPVQGSAIARSTPSKGPQVAPQSTLSTGNTSNIAAVMAGATGAGAFPSINIRSLSVQLQQALNAATLHRTRAQELEMTCRQLRAQLATTQRLLQAAHAGLMPTNATTTTTSSASASAPKTAPTHNAAAPERTPPSFISQQHAPVLAPHTPADAADEEMVAIAADEEHVAIGRAPTLSIMAVALAADMLQAPSVPPTPGTLLDTMATDQCAARQNGEDGVPRDEEPVSKVTLVEGILSKVRVAAVGGSDARDADVRDQDDELASEDLTAVAN